MVGYRRGQRRRQDNHLRSAAALLRAAGREHHHRQRAPAEISTVSLRSKIAKVSQDTFLFPGTIRENLLLANPNATDEQLNATLNQVCLSKFLTQLPNGLDTDIGENGLLLSGGERQKLGLAQGLLRGCKVILLDEVTANVDRDSEEEIKTCCCS